MSISQKIIRFIKDPLRIVQSFNYLQAPISGRIPKTSDYSYSDLFLWRSSQKWETNFSILPYKDLIVPNLEKNLNTFRRSRLIILSHEGKLLHQEIISIKPFNYERISIKKLLISKKNEDIPYGTFLVFHENIPNTDDLSKGYLSDRGYIDYCYNNKKVSSRVHGNLDAISNSFKESNLSNCIPMKSSLLNRKIKLQYLFSSKKAYEIAFTNPTREDHIIKLSLYDRKNNFLRNDNLSLSSFGANIYKVNAKFLPCRVEVKSCHPFPRPLIFTKSITDSIDVFHA